MSKAAQLGSDLGGHAVRIPPTAYILTCCIGVIGANSFVLGPIAPDVAQSLGAAVPNVMFAAAVYGLGAAASALFLAHQIDRFGADRTLKLAMMILPVVLVVSALAPSVSILICAQLFAGVVSGVALPAIYASASAIAPPGRESKTLSIVLTGWMLSLVAGVSLSAILADLVNWRAVYGAVALLAILAALLLTRIKPARRSASKPAALPLAVLGLPGIKPLLVTGAAFLTAFYGVYGYLGDYLHRGLHLPVSTNGLIALAYGLGFGSAVFVDHAVVRIGVRRALPLSVLLVATTYLLLAVFSTTLAGVLLLLAALGLFNHLAINLLIVRLTAIDPTKRGSITGLYSAISNLAVFAGTSGFGPIYSSHGFAVCAYGATVLSLVAALVTTRNWGRAA